MKLGKKTVTSFLEILHTTEHKLAAGIFIIAVLTILLFLGLSLGVSILQYATDGQLFSSRNSDPLVIIEFAGEQMRAGQLTELNIRVINRDGTPYAGLSPIEGKFVHVYMTNENLVMFGHDHPDDYADHMAGSGPLPTNPFKLPILFPKEGKYSIAVQFMTAKGKTITELFPVVVADESGILARSGTPPKIDAQYTKNFSDYMVTFNPVPRSVKTCTPAQLEFMIEKDGKSITDLENFDEGPLVVAGWNSSLSEFISATGRVETAERDTRLAASALFVRPGMYRIFAEFKHEGELIPSSFDLDVQGSTCLDAVN